MLGRSRKRKVASEIITITGNKNIEVNTRPSIEKIMFIALIFKEKKKYIGIKTNKLWHKTIRFLTNTLLT